MLIGPAGWPAASMITRKLSYLGLTLLPERNHVNEERGILLTILRSLVEIEYYAKTSRLSQSLDGSALYRWIHVAQRVD